MKTVRIGEVLCQRCGAPNDFAGEHCSRCGTPLMLVSNPAQHRFEDLATPEPHGEHLLERISVLEHRLARVITIAERAVEMSLRQSELGERMCEMIRSLNATISEMQAQERAHVGITEKLAEELARSLGVQTRAEPAADARAGAPERAASGRTAKPRRSRRGTPPGA